LIRYSEVLLWKAEALIKLDREDEALAVSNQIRERAANSIYNFADGTPVLNFKVQPYIDGVNCAWTNDFAWKAYIWESRLETAGEGRRMLDLVRWGIAEEVMNAHFEKEKTRLEWTKAGFFTKGRDEFLPIPQPEIVWSKGKLTQNPGY
jgi:starch-binding outer membrane protein, SusD/RagB family